jgi:hypothetical protein
MTLLSFGDTDGSLARLLVVDQLNERVRAVAIDGNYVSTFAGAGVTATYGGDGGAIANAQLDRPTGIYFHNGFGDFYVSDANAHRVRRFWDGAWTFDTVVGDGTECTDAPPGCGDGGPAASAQLTLPAGVVMDGDGNLFIADAGAHRVREVLAADGTITTVAGTGVAGTTGDGGAATSAELNTPFGLAFKGNSLYISELQGNVVRAVDMSNGHISTVAGDGSGDILGDGGQAVDAGVAVPMALRFDGDGNLFIGEAGVVRRVDAGTGVITRIAGDGTQGFAGDKGAAISGYFSIATGLAFDNSGNLFVAGGCLDGELDQLPCGTTRVRKIISP